MTTPVPSPSPTLREYDISARSTDVFGRVQASARTHHFIVDGFIWRTKPAENKPALPRPLESEPIAV